MSAPQFLRRYVVSNIQRIQKFPFFSYVCQLFMHNRDDGIRILLMSIITNVIVDQIELSHDYTNMQVIQEFFYLTQIAKVLKVIQLQLCHPDLENDLLQILVGALKQFR